MNCYYSNLIEGHHTPPIDIDRALREDYSEVPAKRALQMEARAHIEVQALIDGVVPDQPPEFANPPTSTAFIRGVHREFCSRLPDDLQWVEDTVGRERVRVIAGEFRRRHVPVSPGAERISSAEFMESLLNPGTLLDRLEGWLTEQVAAGTLHPKSFMLVREAFRRHRSTEDVFLISRASENVRRAPSCPGSSSVESWLPRAIVIR